MYCVHQHRLFFYLRPYSVGHLHSFGLQALYQIIVWGLCWVWDGENNLSLNFSKSVLKNLRIWSKLIILILNRKKLQRGKRTPSNTPVMTIAWNLSQTGQGSNKKILDMKISPWERNRTTCWLRNFSVLLLVIFFSSNSQQLLSVWMSLAFYLSIYFISSQWK